MRHKLKSKMKFPSGLWRHGFILAAILTLSACGTPEKMISHNWVGPVNTKSGHEITPKDAIRHGQSGWVMLRCVAGPGLRATQCLIVAETPTGWGFGDGALRASSNLVARDTTSFGGATPKVGETFHIPVIFCPPDDTSCYARTMEQVRAFNADQDQASGTLQTP